MIFEEGGEGGDNTRIVVGMNEGAAGLGDEPLGGLFMFAFEEDFGGELSIDLFVSGDSGRVYMGLDAGTSVEDILESNPVRDRFQVRGGGAGHGMASFVGGTRDDERIRGNYGG